MPSRHLTLGIVQVNQKGHVMEALKVLFTSDSGLYSLGVILFMVVMGIYLTVHVRKLMNAKPGKEGWD